MHCSHWGNVDPVRLCLLCSSFFRSANGSPFRRNLHYFVSFSRNSRQPPLHRIVRSVVELRFAHFDFHLGRIQCTTGFRLHIRNAFLLGSSFFFFTSPPPLPLFSLFCFVAFLEFSFRWLACFNCGLFALSVSASSTSLYCAAHDSAEIAGDESSATGGWSWERERSIWGTRNFRSGEGGGGDIVSSARGNHDPGNRGLFREGK